VIYASRGNTVRALLVWRELVREVPDISRRRTNLAWLGSQVTGCPWRDGGHEGSLS